MLGNYLIRKLLFYLEGFLRSFEDQILLDNIFSKRGSQGLLIEVFFSKHNVHESICNCTGCSQGISFTYPGLCGVITVNK